jgi:predicted DNA-binding transcriptional regulator YafY
VNTDDLNSLSEQSSHPIERTNSPDEAYGKDRQNANSGLKQEPIKRILHLLRLLGNNECTRQEIFERLAAYYKQDKVSGTIDRSANRMFERDIKLLEEQGFEIQKIKAKGRPTRYSLVKGSGPALSFLFSDPEIEILSLLHNLFTDPTTSTRHPHTGALLLPATPSLHNPYAGEILTFIGKLAATLPPGQIEYFEQRIKRPSVHLNLATAADYLPHRTTIDTIEKAILNRQQLQFEYTSVRSKQETITHQHIDPYYIIHLDGHFYLIGYSNTLNNFFEYRVDRIKTDSIGILPDMVNTVRQRPTVEFSYWLDGDIARLGISQRWLSQTMEREEVYIDSEGQEKRRVLIRARAHNEWRVIQQLLKYGDQAELVEPAHLREQMRRAVARMQSFYEK